MAAAQGERAECSPGFKPVVCIGIELGLGFEVDSPLAKAAASVAAAAPPPAASAAAAAVFSAAVASTAIASPAIAPVVHGCMAP